MEAYAKTKYVRISPRKVKVVLDLIRGKDAGTAMAILKHTPKAASESLIKLLKSACANAEHNFDMDSHNLVVSKCWVTPGTYSQAYDAEGKGKRRPYFEENKPYNNLCC